MTSVKNNQPSIKKLQVSLDDSPKELFKKFMDNVSNSLSCTLKELDKFNKEKAVRTFSEQKKKVIHVLPSLYPYVDSFEPCSFAEGLLILDNGEIVREKDVLGCSGIKVNGLFLSILESNGRSRLVFWDTLQTGRLYYKTYVISFICITQAEDWLYSIINNLDIERFQDDIGSYE